MSDTATSYIRLVQHLIEKCLCFNLSKEECIEALDKYANIQPIITSTVWNELEKENKEFFEAYKQEQVDTFLEMKTMQKVQNELFNASLRDPK